MCVEAPAGNAGLIKIKIKREGERGVGCALVKAKNVRSGEIFGAERADFIFVECSLRIIGR